MFLSRETGLFYSGSSGSWTIKLYAAVDACPAMSLVQRHCNRMLQTCFIVCQSFNEKVA